MAEKDKTLVIVESPAKAKTINKYLGKKYVVEASIGHIKDLMKFNLGIDVEHDFEPKYVTIRGKAPVIKKIKEIASKSNNVLIATDPDREGEAIAWHIAEEIKKTNTDVKRVVFNEITKKNILKSIEEPRDIDTDMFMSQQARRVMDRIIGYKVSPFLSHALLEKTTQSLSAGRVQSVAIRLICEREEIIQAFEPIDYWAISANFATESHEVIKARLFAFDRENVKNPEGSKRGETDEDTKRIAGALDKLHYVKTEEQAQALLKRINEQDYSIDDISKKSIKRRPSSPFTTSLLQQDASKKLGFSNKKTMVLAQSLYEGLPMGEDGTVGLITYMRTDSTRISSEALSNCREYIEKRFGRDYLPDVPPVYASKSTNVQDAHEAIRPTTMKYTPAYVKAYIGKDEAALYELIYNRFLASQMSPAIIDQTTLNIASKDFIFRATGSVVTFRGFLAAYDYAGDEEKNDASEVRLPANLKVNQPAFISNTEANHSQTKPPARYNEASLVKELDELGIGRPSTYAQIVSTLLDRDYVSIKSKAFYPTELGIDVNKVLVSSFPDLFNVDFTAKMEEELDRIAEGKLTYPSLLHEFYDSFSHSLQKAEEKNKEENQGVKCDVCGVGHMVIKVSKRGRFLGCSNYPNCTNTKPIPANGAGAGAATGAGEAKKEPVVAEGIKCDICGSDMYIRDGKYGKFYGCSQYPKCNGVKLIESGITCPKCNEGFLVERYSSKSKKRFWGCSQYPKCNYLTGNEPVKKECPNCHHAYLETRYKKIDSGYEKYLQCPECKEKYEEKDA